MKIKDLNFYVKFVFSTIAENGECHSTTDRELLMCIKSFKTDKSMMNYDIGDEIYFDPIKTPYKITNIVIRRLVEDTDILKIGFDPSDCANQEGEHKDALFIIHITIEKIL